MAEPVKGDEAGRVAKQAILAGGGVLPRLIVEERGKSGAETFVIAFRGITDPDWVVDHPHQWIRLGQLGKALSIVRKQQISQIVFAGHVRRPSWNQIRPDFQGLKMLWRLKRQKIGDDALLRQLADVFAAQGCALVGANEILPQCLMPSGQLSAKDISDDEWKDIHFASHTLQQWAKLDQGQSIVVQNGLILGVEAIEGTDELIRRCGAYKRPGRGPILVKIKKPQQDARLDMPTVGEQTIRNMIDAGFAGMAVEEKQALFLQPGTATELADKHGLFITGFHVHS